MSKGVWCYWLVLTALALLAAGWVSNFDPFALAGACLFVAIAFWYIELRDRGAGDGER